MPQNELQRILSAVRALFTRFYGTLPDLHDLSRIVLMSQQLHGFTHEIVLDLTHNEAWLSETVEDIPIDDGYLPDAVTRLNEADKEEMRTPTKLAVETCWILANG